MFVVIITMASSIHIHTHLRHSASSYTFENIFVLQNKGGAGGGLGWIDGNKMVQQLYI